MLDLSRQHNPSPPMSALSHEQTSRHVRVMSVIPLKADIHQGGLRVRFVPKADILRTAIVRLLTMRSRNRANTRPRGGPRCAKFARFEWALCLTSPQRQRFKFEERTTGHEDCAIQRIALCRRQKASNVSRQPFHQRLRKSAN